MNPLYKENTFVQSPYLQAKFDSVINNLKRPRRSNPPPRRACNGSSASFMLAAEQVHYFKIIYRKALSFPEGTGAVSSISTTCSLLCQDSLSRPQKSRPQRLWTVSWFPLSLGCVEAKCWTAMFNNLIYYMPVLNTFHPPQENITYAQITC